MPSARPPGARHTGRPRVPGARGLLTPTFLAAGGLSLTSASPGPGHCWAPLTHTRYSILAGMGVAAWTPRGPLPVEAAPCAVQPRPTTERVHRQQALGSHGRAVSSAITAGVPSVAQLPQDCGSRVAWTPTSSPHAAGRGAEMQAGRPQSLVSYLERAGWPVCHQVGSS